MTDDPNRAQLQRVEAGQAIVRSYVDAVNRKDLEAILALYAEDAHARDPVGLRDFSGKAELRTFYEGVCANNVTMEITGPIRGSFADAVAAPIRAMTPGRCIDVITVTRVNEDGLIVDYAAYWGPGDVRSVQQGEPGS